MKTQISRWSDDPAKRRAAIYQQQGRMLTDADLNELTELLKRRIDEALGDIVGNGAPRSATVGVIENGPLIRRAVVYVDGIRARLESTVAGTAPFALTQQADFPSPPAYPAGDQALYADVWEWSETALQDASLLDPGLHGADTATRTLTLAQVKWCPGAIDPLTDPRNPSKGDALVTLAIREGTNAADPCDACAEEIALEGHIGNYLFRVEVHDVQGPADAPTEITLKWSAENGAEQHAQSDVPVEFTRGDWIYEFYSDTTEKHIGVHLTPGFQPARSILQDGWPSTANLPDPNTLPYVRRWDGYAVLVRSGAVWSVKAVASVLQAKDKGRVFQLLPNGTTPTHGHYIYTAPNLIAQLSGLSLTITLDGKKFVAGDYWLAAVRESAQADKRVQPPSSTPLGVTHHYAMLARANGPTVQALSDADVRRLSFPRLTDLTADHVGYSPTAQASRWTDVIDDNTVAAPLNVQRAIDLLVERLESSDIRFVIPGCGTATAPTVRSLLNLTAGSTDKIDSVLTKLLCDFKATHLPIDKSAPGLPPIVNVPTINSVQQALHVLAGSLAGQTCEATVGTGGQYPTLIDAFTALAAANDISLCLLPGIHNLPAGANITGKGTVKLSGIGAYASKITLGAQLQLGAREIIVRDLSMVGPAAASIVLQADRVVARNSAFARATAFNSHLWSKRFGGAGGTTDRGVGVGVDSAGNVVLTGSFSGTVSFGGATFQSAGFTDIFIAKFDSAGNHVWSKATGATGFDGGTSVAIDSSGNAVVTGVFSGTINFGGGNLVSIGGDVNTFIVKFDSAGNHVWSKNFGGGSSGASVVIDTSQNILLTGSFSGSINLGGGDLFSAGGSDIYIAKLNSAGNLVWSKRFGGTFFDSGTCVAVDAAGNVALTGHFSDVVNFGGANLLAVGSTDIFLVKLSSSGVHLWSKSFGSGLDDFGAALAFDASGNVVLTGAFQGTINLGGGNFTSIDTSLDMFTAKFDGAGNLLWSRSFPGTGLDGIGGIAIDATGNVLLTGFFSGTLNLGGPVVLTAGGTDIFVAKLDSLGKHLWSKRFGGAIADAGMSVAIDSSGNLMLTGLFSGAVNFGGATLQSAGGEDIFLAKLAFEPSLSPLVTIRPRDATHGTDLVWSQNDMLATAAENGVAPEPRTALALATHNIGGAIVDNTIDGRILLLSDLPVEISEPLAIPGGITSAGGGAYLTIRGNHVARVSSRYETGAPNLDAFGSLIMTDNMVVETNNSLIAEAITLDNNQFQTRTTFDTVGVTVARQMTIVGNQATHPEAQLRIVLSSFREAANALTVTRTGYPSFNPNTAAVWYFGGVGVDLL